MACSNVKEIPVFAHTNLGTRIVVAVSPDTTVGDFKREFERAHLNCFQELGNIRVYRLKVKKKSCFYDLPESFPLKHIFESLKNHILHIEVYQLEHQSGPAESQGADICNPISDFKNVPNTTEVQKFFATTTKNWNRYRRKKKGTKRILRTRRIFCFKSLLWEFPRVIHFLKRKNCKCINRRNIAAKIPPFEFQQGPYFSENTANHFASTANSKWGKELELDNNPQIEGPSETLSETISVSGIIKRYFTNYDEVTSSSRFSFLALPTVNKEYSMGETASSYQNREFDMSLPLMANTPPEILQPQSLDQHKPKASRGTDEKNVEKKVGRCLVAASDNLGVSVSKQTPTLSLCKLRYRDPLVPNSSAPIKNLVFDITDEDD